MCLQMAELKTKPTVERDTTNLGGIAAPWGKPWNKTSPPAGGAGGGAVGGLSRRRIEQATTRKRQRDMHALQRNRTQRAIM